MTTIGLRTETGGHGAAEDEFLPLTAEQAQKLRQELRSISPWMVIAWQLVAGVLVAAVCAAVAGKSSAAWSAAYGALAVVVPAALLARGITSRTVSGNAGAAALGFLVWEFVKIALTVAMLLAAPRVVESLSWPLLLLGMVLTMKVYWVALLWQRKHKD
jgi:ATP synthase protein I